MRNELLGMGPTWLALVCPGDRGVDKRKPSPIPAFKPRERSTHEDPSSAARVGKDTAKRDAENGRTTVPDRRGSVFDRLDSGAQVLAHFRLYFGKPA